MQNNLKVAITGGIGSGKSTVAKIITEQGFRVISCDEIYKSLLKDKNFLLRLNNEFGDILTDNGELDREKLSAIVFNDKNKIKKLNKLTHPAVMEDALGQMTGDGMFFCEVPLLFEGGFEKLFDNVIVVMRNLDDRINSVSERDGLDKKAVISRINSQFNYDNQTFEKYYVIHNNSDLSVLHDNVMAVLNDLKYQFIKK